MGIEPTSEAWEASILPLYDARSLEKHHAICSIALGSRAAQEAAKCFCDLTWTRSSDKIERHNSRNLQIPRAHCVERSPRIPRSRELIDDRVVEVKPVEIGDGHRAFSYARGDGLI